MSNLEFFILEVVHSQPDVKLIVIICFHLKIWFEIISIFMIQIYFEWLVICNDNKSIQPWTEINCNILLVSTVNWTITIFPISVNLRKKLSVFNFLVSFNSNYFKHERLKLWFRRWYGGGWKGSMTRSTILTRTNQWWIESYRPKFECVKVTREMLSI